jgi:iron(II)-dependent oxidoreductase
MSLIKDKHFKLPATELFELLTDARPRTLELVADLTDEQFTVPKVVIVNPFNWELGHVAFFYDAFLLGVLGAKEYLIEGGGNLYDSFKVDHDDRWDLPLPQRKETLDYMKRVHERTVNRLESREPNTEETYYYLLSLLHEYMHGEAFTYMRQTLKYSEPQLSVAVGKGAARGVGNGPLPGDVEIPGGLFQLGATPEVQFLFDNEKMAHPVEVAPFKMARAPITNGEFAAFVENHGYGRSELWSYQGWVWRSKNEAAQPIYWKRDGNGWLRRHYDRFVPLELHAPMVHVTWYEAEAYCKWAGRRLPTEAEWELAASAEPTPDGKGITARKRKYPWGDDLPTHDRANLDSRIIGCVDVAAFPSGDSAFGCRQMAGNVWEWTASAFYPFPGYIVDYPYKEYSAPWFGYRKVLKGGAWATRSRLAYNAYRNFFLPDRCDIFAGFRTCVV